MKLNFKTVVAPALILCLICFCVTGLLGLTNSLTKDKIEQAAAEKEASSRMLVMPSAESFEQSEDGTYYTALSGSDVVGYVFATSSKGYGGDVKVMTGINTDGIITGTVILSQNETPGLGANCTNKKFLVKFEQTATNLEVVKNVEATDGQIEAMTGATITSKAVTSAVNMAVEIYETIGGAN